MEEDHDSDIGDILDNLLGNDAEPEIDELPKQTLKELDFNFIDCVEPVDPALDSKDKKISGLVHEDLDSSDDEDRRNFEEQKYSESGRNIRDLLKKQEFDKSTSYPLVSQSNDIAEKIKRNTFPVEIPEKESKKLVTSKPALLQKWLDTPPDIYTDPVFGLRIVTPLVSSTELKERMKGRNAVTVSKIKHFITTENLENDWAIAGVIINRSGTRKSKNGNAYCIWTVSDLGESMNTVTIFLFKNAYKQFWKTTDGSVIGVLNPAILESRNDKDQACLSVDVPQKIMVLGNSKDMGRCKSKKKNGEPCTSIVNLSKCEYCTYHVKSEYNKASRRQDLQTDRNNRKFGNNPESKAKNASPGIYAQGGHRNMLAIPAKRNLKYEKQDSDKLALLMATSPASIKPENSIEPTKVNLDDKSRSQTKQDFDRLNKMRGWSSSKPLLSVSNASNFSQPLKPTSTAPAESKSSPGQSIPRLGFGLNSGTIDFSTPITNNQRNAAKMNAIKWIQQKGGLKRSNPNKIHESKEKIAEAAKRRREEEEEKIEDEPKAKKINLMSDKFKELLEAKSAHTDLIEKADNSEKEKYFNKLEAKERMEEKMINTTKVNCKAVKCLVCKYTSFSASDICKEKKHPLRVIDAVKSFFKCSDCGNRTVSLDRLPSQACKKCSGSSWLRTGMMSEKKTKIPGAALSIRGGEQKFIGSDVTDFSLNLLVPDPDG